MESFAPQIANVTDKMLFPKIPLSQAHAATISIEPVWLLPPWLHQAFSCIEANMDFFNKGIPNTIPKFIDQIPTDNPSTLINFSNIITAIVSAMESASSLHQASIAWHLFLWIPHLLLIEVLESGTSHQDRESLLIRDILCLTSCDPKGLFDRLFMQSNYFPLAVPHPFIKTDASILTPMDIKRINSAFSKGRISRAMQILVGNSLPSFNISSESHLKNLCDSYFSDYPIDTPSILQILNSSLHQWPNQAPDIISQQDLFNGIQNLAITANGATGWCTAMIKQLFVTSDTVRNAFHYITKSMV